MKKQKIIAVSGPTASGKSALALAIAEEFQGEIVSCDSMQIYRGMDIGTAKPTPEERARIPHHMIDLLSPGEDCSCADFVSAAHRCIGEILDKGRLPVLCGGTGLYMDNILFDTSFSSAGKDPAYRASLLALSPGEVHDMLRAVDPESAAAIHENNRGRVIRALEIYRLTGIPKSVWDKRSRQRESRYLPLRICLTASRSLLYGRIDRRVEEMFRLGLAEEVKALLPSLRGTAAAAIGYKETAAYLRGEYGLPEAVEKVKKATRNYAKRQLTWLRRDAETQHVLSIDGKSGDALLAEARALLLPFLKEEIPEEH